MVDDIDVRFCEELHFQWDPQMVGLCILRGHFSLSTIRPRGPLWKVSTSHFVIIVQNIY